MNTRPNIPQQIFVGATQGTPSCTPDSNIYEVWPKLLVMVLLNGSQHFEMDGVRFDISAGDGETATPIVFMLNVADFCSLRFFNESSVPLNKVQISVPRPWIETLLNTNPEEMPKLKHFLDGHLNTFEFTPGEKITQAVAQMLNPPPSVERELQSLHRRSLGMDILYTACANLIAETGRGFEEKPSQNIGKRRQAENIRHHILGSISQELTIAGIARALHSNASTIQRTFKDHYGMTVFHFIRNERLERARSALETQGMSVSQAAYMCGYENPASFATAFRKLYGITPKQLKSGFVG